MLRKVRRPDAADRRRQVQHRPREGEDRGRHVPEEEDGREAAEECDAAIDLPLAAEVRPQPEWHRGNHRCETGGHEHEGEDGRRGGLIRDLLDVEVQRRLQGCRRDVEDELRHNDGPDAPAQTRLLWSPLVVAPVAQASAPMQLSDLDRRRADRASLHTLVEAPVAEAGAPMQLPQGHRSFAHPAMALEPIVAIVAQAAAPPRLAERDILGAQLA
mmetsp:Transcript_15259/g.44100  ORF Transcript_15259/g.44100 Transcript_15259/m.44100 type:complete len:215 (-) Transcript_15259:772-1416(-)